MVKKFVNHSTVKLNWIVALAAVGFSMPAMAQKAAKPKKKAPVAVAPVAPNVAAQRLAIYKKFELKTQNRVCLR